MKNYTQEPLNKKCDTHIVRRFYFKVNHRKNEKVFRRQVNKVLDRIGNKYNLLNADMKIDTGHINEDIVLDRFTLRISVDCV